VTGLGIANINTLALSGTGNRLHGFDAGSQWTITGLDRGTVTSGSQTVGFSGFQSLIGAPGNNDNFIFTGPSSALSSIDGNGGINSITGRSTTDTWTLGNINFIS